MKYLPHKLFIAFIIIFGLGFAAGRFTLPPAEIPQDRGAENTPFPSELNFKNLLSVWNILQEKYFDAKKLTPESMVDNAISGFVDGIGDPYTVYLNKKDSQTFEQSLNSELEGIGAELEMKDGLLTIINVLEESPALKAGLKGGDVITEIDGETTDGITLYKAVSKIRGKAGTKVTLTIFRENGEQEIFDVTIVRRRIEIESVTYEKLPENIGLISVNQFSNNTTQEFSAIANKILLEAPQGLILDLRGNGGGYLDISIDLISEFISGKQIAARIKSRIPEENEEIFTGDNARLGDIPLAVLVDGGSASASEIVAGAIQDYKRGFIFGEKTYGKGTVQEIETLEDGSTLRFTIAEWLTPLKRSIDKIGITPDRIVEIPKDFEGERDPQLEAAVQYLTQG